MAGRIPANHSLVHGLLPVARRSRRRFMCRPASSWLVRSPLMVPVRAAGSPSRSMGASLHHQSMPVWATLEDGWCLITSTVSRCMAGPSMAVARRQHRPLCRGGYYRLDGNMESDLNWARGSPTPSFDGSRGPNDQRPQQNTRLTSRISIRNRSYCTAKISFCAGTQYVRSGSSVLTPVSAESRFCPAQHSSISSDSRHIWS